MSFYSSMNTVPAASPTMTENPGSSVFLSISCWCLAFMLRNRYIDPSFVMSAHLGVHREVSHRTHTWTHQSCDPFFVKVTVLLRNETCWWKVIEMYWDNFTVAPLFKWPFHDNAVWFLQKDTDVCPGFHRLFWDELAAGLSFVGSC